MYEIGQKVIHNICGVCTIVSIETREFSGSNQYYRLENRDYKTILVPVSRAWDVRPLGTLDMAADALNVLNGSMDAMLTLPDAPWKERYKAYQETMDSNRMLPLASVLRDIYKRAQTRPMTFGERKVYEKIVKFLKEEFQLLNLELPAIY